MFKRIRKKRILASVTLWTLLQLIVINVYGQKMINNWQHMDLNTDSIFGVSTERAYKSFIKTVKLSPIIVAIIDGGLDTAHQDLKNVLWRNELEIPNNGKDDDHNGYVDDINGWNFLGSSKGSFQYDNLDLVRQLRISINNDKNSLRTKELQLQLFSRREYMKVIFKDVSEKRHILLSIINNIGKKTPTENDFRNYHYKDYSEQQMLVYIVRALKTVPDFTVIQKELDAKYQNCIEHLNYLLNLNYDPRSGKQFKKEKYGNSDVQGSLANHATHVAGIISGFGKIKLGSKINDNLKLMILRAVPTGDYLDSEMANAIRYAVDNGAKVINISIDKAGVTDRLLIDNAIKYAMIKDVLIVHACGNQGKKLEESLFPQKYYQDGGQADGWIEVGASAMKNDSSLLYVESNYGERLVDVFAPGFNINSSMPDNKYEYHSGTSMATPVISGISAILRSCYPKLTAAQIKSVILNSVVKVNHQVKTRNGQMVPFSQTCISGGIANLYYAFRVAALL